jgi:CTD small phosphatase-like protein 2
VAPNFQRQPENGIEIRSWYDDPKDTALAELAPILLQIAKHPSEDLRIALATYGD